MAAAQNGLTTTVTELLRCPAHASRFGGRAIELNAVDREGRTAMHLAAENVFSDIMELLLNAGADATLQDNIKEATAAQVLAEAEMQAGLDNMELF